MEEYNMCDSVQQKLYAACPAENSMFSGYALSNNPNPQHLERSSAHYYYFPFGLLEMGCLVHYFMLFLSASLSTHGNWGWLRASKSPEWGGPVWEEEGQKQRRASRKGRLSFSSETCALLAKSTFCESGAVNSIDHWLSMRGLMGIQTSAWTLTGNFWLPFCFYWLKDAVVLYRFFVCIAKQLFANFKVFVHDHWHSHVDMIFSLLCVIMW